MKAEVITFQERSGTGNQTVNLSDSTLTPSLIIFVSTQASTTNAFSTDCGWNFGAWDGTRNVSLMSFSLNGQGTSSAYRRTQDSYCFHVSNSSSTIVDSCVVSAVAAGSFTLNWDNQTAQRFITAFVFEVDNAYANFITHPSGTGSQAYTGFGFQPDAVFLSTVINQNSTTNSTHGIANLGWSDGTNSGAVSISSRQGVTTSVTNNRIDDSAVILGVFNDAINTRATLTSFDSDGITLNFTNNPGANRSIVVAIGGVTAEVDAVFDYPTSTGNSTISSTIASPKIAFEANTRNTSVDATSAGANMMLGAYDGTSQAALWIGDEDNQGTTDVDRYHDTGAMVLVADYAQAIDGEATANALSSGVTRNFSNALAAAYKGTALFLGDAAGSSVSATLATLEIAPLSASVSVGTTIAATAGSVEITGLAASISVGTSIAATTATLEVAALAASVSVGTTIQATVADSQISPLAASISVGTTIDATLATIQISPLTASVSAGTTINATLATVELAGLSVGVSAGTSIAATTATAEISGLSASVDNTATINATLGTMQASGLAASVSVGTTIQATTATVDTAGLSANVSAGTTIQSTLATVDVSPLTASVSAGTTIQATLATVEVTGLAVSVSVGATIDATLATLEVTAFAASVSNAVAFTGFIYVTGEQMLKSTVTGEQMLKPSVTDETMIHGN